MLPSTVEARATANPHSNHPQVKKCEAVHTFCPRLEPHMRGVVGAFSACAGSMYHRQVRGRSHRDVGLVFHNPLGSNLRPPDPYFADRAWPKRAASEVVAQATDHLRVRCPSTRVGRFVGFHQTGSLLPRCYCIWPQTSSLAAWRMFSCSSGVLQSALDALYVGG